MSNQDILTQLETSYGKPTPMALHNINILFRSAMAPTDVPKMLFYRIKQCQEIATLAGDPYTPMQIMNTVMRILMQVQVLPSKEFDTWEQMAVKTYLGLKTLVHEAYTRRLQSLVLCTTTGQQGYVPGGNNMFNMLSEQEDKEDVNKVNDETTVKQTAVLTTGSTLRNTYGGAATIPLEITAAIDQLAANQVAIQQQMAAMTFTAPPPPQTCSFTSPLCRTWGSSHLQERLRGFSTQDKGVEATSEEDVVGDAHAGVVEDADVVHLQTKRQEEMEVFPHL